VSEILRTTRTERIKKPPTKVGQKQRGYAYSWWIADARYTAVAHAGHTVVANGRHIAVAPRLKILPHTYGIREYNQLKQTCTMIERDVLRGSC
jgi:hypothetical protein